MLLDRFSFGTIRIDGVTRGHDVIIDRGEVRKRDTDMVAYSRCENCDEQGMVLDLANCARCLVGREPLEIDEEATELSEPLLRLSA